MAPVRSKKRKSSSSTADDYSARPQTVEIKSPLRTPIRSPLKKATGITETQKQALIDNLQLEVTERARKLRAQYALQAQSLRTRIELRINRIPTSLRKANMGELYKKYQEISKAKQKAVPEEPKPKVMKDEGAVAGEVLPGSKEARSTVAPPSRGVKRSSDAMGSADKENASESAHDIPNPKKRSKATKGPSRQVTNPSTVLSPKSANSRTLPQSPVRPVLGSPQKSYLSHAASPLKPFSPVKITSPAKITATANLAAMVGEKPKAGRPKAGTARKGTNPATTTKAGTVRAKRGAGPPQESEDVRKVSNTSNVSSTSNATTVVKNAKRAPTAGGRKNEIGIRATGKKVAAGAEAPPAGRRVLRKRA